jgi:hypothetical protein
LALVCREGRAKSSATRERRALVDLNPLMAREKRNPKSYVMKSDFLADEGLMRLI